jgi:hypothetical protein
MHGRWKEGRMTNTFRVALLTLGKPPEIVFETEHASEAACWVEEWLTDPLGLPVVVIRPRFKRQRPESREDQPRPSAFAAGKKKPPRACRASRRG